MVLQTSINEKFNKNIFCRYKNLTGLKKPIVC